MLDVLFVHNYYEQHPGIMQISAVLKLHGFTTNIAIGTQDEIIQKALAARPRIMGFYCTTGFHHKNIAAAKKIKSLLGNQTLTILGGPHPTFVPGIIEEEGIDMICRGEGEEAFLELLQAVREGKDYSRIKNLTVKIDGRIIENELRPLCDINALPHVDREIYKDYPFIYNLERHEVIIGRGCPFDCTFCASRAYRDLYRGKGAYVRLRTIDNIIDELKGIKARYKVSCFHFTNDTFIVKRDFCFALLERYKKEISKPFSCLIRADLVEEALIKALKEAGCYLVGFGIESGSSEIRNKLLKKRLSDEQILLCARLLRQYRIPFSSFNMIGFPGETLKDVWATVDLNARIKPNWAWFSCYQTLPGTELADYALEHHYLHNIDVHETDATFHESSLLLEANPEGKKMIRLKNNANLIIKMPWLRGFIKTIILPLPLNPLINFMNKILFFIFYYSKLSYKRSFWKTLRAAFFLLTHLKEFK